MLALFILTIGSDTRHAVAEISSDYVICQLVFRFRCISLSLHGPCLVDSQSLDRCKQAKWSRERLLHPFNREIITRRARSVQTACSTCVCGWVCAVKLFRNKRNDERFNYKSFVSTWAQLTRTHIIIARIYDCRLCRSYSRLLRPVIIFLSSHFSCSK